MLGFLFHIPPSGFFIFITFDELGRGFVVLSSPGASSPLLALGLFLGAPCWLHLDRVSSTAGLDYQTGPVLVQQLSFLFFFLPPPSLVTMNSDWLNMRSLLTLCVISMLPLFICQWDCFVVKNVFITWCAIHIIHFGQPLFAASLSFSCLAFSSFSSLPSLFALLAISIS